MQIEMEMSRANVVRNGVNPMEGIGVMPPHGYCFDHEEIYALVQGDEMCKSCERFQFDAITERESEYSPEHTETDYEE